MSRYLEFVEDEKGTIVLSKKRAGILGEIRFYKPWKQHIFEPVSNAIFNDKCLQDIIQFIQDKNMERFESDKKDYVN